MCANENQISIRHDALKTYFIRNDELILIKFIQLVSISLGKIHNIENFMKHFMREEFFSHFSGMYYFASRKGVQTTRKHIISSILSLPCKSILKSLVVKQQLLDKFLQSLIKPYPRQNKMFYKLHQLANNESLTFDPSTSKIWYAIMLMSQRDFSSALRIVNNVLSSIPPFYLCTSMSNHDTYNNSRDAEQLYAEKFMNSGLTVMERAREAWLMPLMFGKYMTDIVPLAIQIELYFCDSITLFDYTFVKVTPIVMLHYLAFQCYHELGQYDHRDNALSQLLDSVKADDIPPDSCNYSNSFNVVGHCCLIAGDMGKARHMFTLSKQRENISKFPCIKRHCCCMVSPEFLLRNNQ